MRRNNHHHHHQHHTHMDWESVRSGPRQEQPPPPPYHFPHRYDRLAVTAVPSAAAAAALPAVPSLAQISAAHQTPPVQSSPAPTITGVSMQNATQGLQHRAQHGPSIALPTESAEPGLARPASAVPTRAPTSRMRHNPYQMHTDPTAMREPGPYQPPLRSAHGYAVPVSRPAYMMEHLPPPPRPVSGYWPDTQPASPFVAAGFPSTSHMRPVDRAYHSGGAMRGPTLHRGGFSQRGPQPPLWDSPPMAPLEPRWPPPPMALRPPPPMALRPPPPMVRPPPAVQQRLDRQLDRLNRLILRHARNRHPFIDTSDSDASDMADDSNFCTLCFADEAVWHCSEDDTAVCEECLERLVGDTQPGPLCCPDCRAGLIPAKLIEEHLPQTVVEKYRTRRSAGIRGDANQWLQSAVRALIAGEPAPQPWLPSSKASRPVRGHSPAETTYESALMDRLGGEAQQQVQRTWERLRSISCKETLTKELTRLEDESLAIACPSAKMCPRCNYGPVLKTGCDDLAQHHGERQTSNCCRGCGFFAVEVNAWKSWDFVNRLDLPNGPAVDNDISRLAACASVSENAAINAIRSSNGNLDAAFDLLIRGSVVRNHQQQFHALRMPAGWTRW